MRKYYIVNSTDVESFKPKMQAAYGHSNVAARPSLDGTLSLMEFNDDDLPQGYNGTGYTYEEIMVVLAGPDWTSDEPYLEENI